MFLAVILAALCLACSVASAANVPRYEKVYYDVDDADNLYKKYLQEYNKQYTVEEYGKRLEIFKETLKEINEQNSLFPQTVFGPTMFSDMTTEEKKSFGCVINNSNGTETVELELTPGVVYEENFDWRDKGVVTPIKNQGQCGSCYIFSAIGSIESQYAIKHQQCLSFSEQQALDCMPSATCDGGTPVDIMNGLAGDSSGVMLESDYPYTAVKAQCVENASKKSATVLSGQQLSVSDEETLKQNLVQYGPLSIMMYSSGLHIYHGGVLTPTGCDSDLHAVLLVGYGEESGTPYWIIKNSWGLQFGEEGYLRLKRGIQACGIPQTGVATSQVG